MSAPVSLPTTAAWVWHTGPRPVPGLDAVFVRCATGASGSGSGNFDFARNWRRWKDDGRTRAVPWTWFGPPASSNGSACADVLHQIAPGEPVYIVDIQHGPPADQVVTFARRMRKLEPSAKLGFSSYPTKVEAEGRGGVPWDACVEAFDFGLPQVYNARQRAALLKRDSPVVADMGGKPIHVAVFPDADAEWPESAQLGLLHHLGTSGWSLDQSSFERWCPQLAALAEDRPDLRGRATRARGRDIWGTAGPGPGSGAAATQPGPGSGAAATQPGPGSGAAATRPGPDTDGANGAGADPGGATLGDPGAVARARALVDARGDQIAARVLAVVEQHVVSGGDLTDERLVTAVKRALSEGLGADNPG